MKIFTEKQQVERLMQEKPIYDNKRKAIVLPQSHKCYDCVHYEELCYALCHRQGKEGNEEK